MSWQLPLGAQLTPEGVLFRVWAPHAQRVDVALFEAGAESARHVLDKEEDGYWQGHVPSIGAGTRYGFSIDGDEPRPDPASRSQPDGVHAPSAVVDPQGFQWTDGAWHGIPLDDVIVYEVHVGTVTPEGTFDSLIAKLPYFRDLGVTALEIMPVADFPGQRNWGYDGVDLYAPANAYGGPDGFKQLVDAAHAHGLAIILDVVYNHFGPDGNYLRVYSPDYFTSRHHTPWGDALNLDSPGSRAVRDFLINNALYWAHEYHVDGLRLDATHALIDDSPEHLLRELTTAVHASLPADRHFVIMAEDERNLDRIALPVEQNGYGLDGVWADDFHHQVRVALTGEHSGYFADFSGTTADLAKTIVDGWFYQGQRSKVTDHERGTSPQALRLSQFVFCIQNHDQIGNRPIGDRLNHIVDPAAYRAASALLLLAPETPLLFQGQEWAASSPFQFFTDHNEELGKLVTEGRRKEFSYFLTETGIEVPDPQAPSTFTNSKLQWDELEQPEHAAVLSLYRDLIQLRRTHPALQRLDRESVQVAPLNENVVVLRRQGDKPEDTLLIVVNLVAQANVELDRIDGRVMPLRVLLDTNDARYGGTAVAELIHERPDVEHLKVRAPSVVVLARES